MSKKLLVISGPTATGKTALAIKLAKKINGVIISADSRQIYKGLDIGTGKDHPKNIKIELVDLINPDQVFSVADYQKLALQAINTAWKNDQLPILVGCSGFYISSILKPSINTFSVKPNNFLRFFLNRLPLAFLQQTLKLLDFKTFKLLNNSDINNPFRLIRKIEIKLSNKKTQSPPLSKGGLRGDSVLHLSLTAPNNYIYSQIDKRVEKRLKLGQLNEIKNLLKTYHWTDPGLKISSYAVFKSYFDHPNSSTLKSAITKWKFAEHRDARHQKCSAKICPPDYIIDVTTPNFLIKTNSLVSKWYNQL